MQAKRIFSLGLVLSSAAYELATQNPIPAAAEVLRKSRRVVWRCFMFFSRRQRIAEVPMADDNMGQWRGEGLASECNTFRSRLCRWFGPSFAIGCEDKTTASRVAHVFAGSGLGAAGVGSGGLCGWPRGAKIRTVAAPA